MPRPASANPNPASIRARIRHTLSRKCIALSYVSSCSLRVKMCTPAPAKVSPTPMANNFKASANSHENEGSRLASAPNRRPNQRLVNLLPGDSSVGRSRSAAGCWRTVFVFGRMRVIDKLELTFALAGGESKLYVNPDRPESDLLVALVGSSEAATSAVVACPRGLMIGARAHEVRAPTERRHQWHLHVAEARQAGSCRCVQMPQRNRQRTYSQPFVPLRRWHSARLRHEPR
jgi:hypothetical protein